MLNGGPSLSEYTSPSQARATLRHMITSIIYHTSLLSSQVVLARLLARLRTFGTVDHTVGSAVVESAIDFDIIQHVHMDKNSLIDLLKGPFIISISLQMYRSVSMQAI